MQNSCVDIEKVTEYVVSKQGKDGGYLSYQYMDIFESSAEDTYYAISSLHVLRKKPPRDEETARFLLSLQHEDGGYASLPVAYFAIKALSILGSRPRNVEGAAKYLMNALKYALKEYPRGYSRTNYKIDEHFLPDGSLKSFDATSLLVEVEVPTALANISLAIEGLAELGYTSLDGREDIIDFILKLKESDGGFGVFGTSIGSVYHAVKSLLLLGYDVGELYSTREWVLACEHPEGGFGVKPGTRTYFLENIYYGVEVLSMMGEKPRYPDIHAKLTCMCQNGDGGFRRSPVLGSSTLEYTYYAVQVLKRLGYL